MFALEENGIVIFVYDFFRDWANKYGVEGLDRVDFDGELVLTNPGSFFY
jgi:hypothetical protein